eukprot:s1_g1703.t1
MDVMAAANRLEAQGRSIMHLEVGQPGAPVPDAVRSVAAHALNAGPLAYTDALGLPSLRARIAQYYAEHHNLEVDPGRVVVTAGSSAAFILTFLACFGEGDKVAVPEPGYPAYRNTLRALGCEPVTIPVGPESDWALTPELIERAEQESGLLKGVLVASPSNPTGAMLTRPQMKALVETCEANGRWFLSDEIYHRITYDHEDVSALEAGEDVVVINSFSKYYCMTGWRLGWAVVPDRLVRPIERLAQNLFISPPTLSQIAAEKAFDEKTHLDGNVAVYAENRRLLLEELPKAGITTFAPADGAFYLYADVSYLTDDSATFCEAMLQEAGVAATPGIDFDPTHGHQYVRFSFAGKTSDMAEAARRLQKWSST